MRDNLNKRQTRNLNDVGDKVCFPSDVVWSNMVNLVKSPHIHLWLTKLTARGYVSGLLEIV